MIGLPCDVPNHASYLQSWIAVLEAGSPRDLSCRGRSAEDRRLHPRLPPRLRRATCRIHRMTPTTRCVDRPPLRWPLEEGCSHVRNVRIQTRHRPPRLGHARIQKPCAPQGATRSRRSARSRRSRQKYSGRKMSRASAPGIRPAVTITVPSTVKSRSMPSPNTPASNRARSDVSPTSTTTKPASIPPGAIATPSSLSPNFGSSSVKRLPGARNAPWGVADERDIGKFAASAPVGYSPVPRTDEARQQDPLP